MNRVVFAAVVCTVAGCGGGSDRPTTPEHGAKAAVVQFFEAVIATDDARAREALDAAGRKLPADTFTRRADGYRKAVGFPVERVHVRACEEQGDRATAHVTLSGHTSGHVRRFNDAVIVRRQDGRWGVVLNDTFGRKTR